MSDQVKRISLGYVPRPWQDEVHASMKRFSVLCVHRRAGKSHLAAIEMIDRALRCIHKNPQIAYIAPTYSAAKRIAWTVFKSYTNNIPGTEANEAELRVDLPRPAMGDRIRWMLLGAENPQSLRGIYLDYAVLDEHALMTPEVFTEIIRPTLVDRKGGALFISTPKGATNQFAEFFEYGKTGQDPEWMSKLYTVDDTKVIPQDELESLKRNMSEQEVAQEFYCSWAAGLVGAYWAKEMENAEKENRVTSVPYDPALPVDTFWDLGMSDVTSIWFAQRHYAQWRLIDYREAPDTGLAEWVRIIKDTKYTHGKAYLPHDVKVRELGTGKSRLEVMQQLMGRSTIKIVPRIEDKLDSIEAARRIIPRCIFDAVKCAKGIKALKSYQRRWDEKSQAYSPKPLHNFASHAADSFQGFAMAAQEDRGDIMDGKPLPREYEDSGSLFTHMGGR